MLEGFACGHKLLPDGRRQIVSLLRTRGFLRASHDHADATGLLDQQHFTGTGRQAGTIENARCRPPVSRLACALWKTTLVEQAIAHEWLVNVGQRTAFSRAAHLLCEMFLRPASGGTGSGTYLRVPLTQTEIADTLALSTVHVNRTLMELRRSGLITLRDKQLTIHHLPGSRQPRVSTAPTCIWKPRSTTKSLPQREPWIRGERAKIQLAGRQRVADIICGRDWSRTPLDRWSAGPAACARRWVSAFIPHPPSRCTGGRAHHSLQRRVCAVHRRQSSLRSRRARSGALADIWDTVGPLLTTALRQGVANWLSQPAGARQT